VPGLFDLCLILPGAIFLFPENGVIAIINDLPKEQNPEEQMSKETNPKETNRSERSTQNHEPQDDTTGLHGSDIQLCEAGNGTDKASTACTRAIRQEYHLRL
jgi:hypothetical protein